MSASAERAGAWNATMTATPGELDLDVPASAIEGRIPPELAGGRYLQNGPGWTRIGDRLAHPFDGHGLMRALTFRADGSAGLRSRFVRTPAYLAEREAGRLVYRGLGTNPTDSGWRNLRAPAPRNVANTTVQPWAGRLLAGWEGGRPYALDARTLETLGEETFGGALPEGAFLAHMRVDGPAGRLVGCGLKMGWPTRFSFREFSEAGQQLSCQDVDIPGMHFVHDFVITSRWYVLPGNPLSVDWRGMARAQLGRGTLLEAIVADARPMGVIYLVPRGRPGPVRVVTLPQRAFVVHFANAFDTAGDGCVVDLCAFESFRFGEEFGYQGPGSPLDPDVPDRRDAIQRLYRATISADGAVGWRALSDHGLDFPRVHPGREGQEVPAIYAATRADRTKSDPFDAVARVDAVDLDRPTEVWTAGRGQFVGEPVFVPRPGAQDPDDGWLIACVYSPAQARTWVGVFEPQALGRGPVASIPLPLQPYGFHGAWDPGPTRP